MILSRTGNLAWIVSSSTGEIWYPPDHILKPHPDAVQHLLLFLLPNNAVERPMASRLERLSFDILLPKVRRGALPRQSAFLFATAREKDYAILRNMA